ncbi:ankyrin repeat and SAM domain-containing protein 6-like [Dioscorea cayenensis subsp. rotundata]|uniref:Ankyrin repeat and SAM domain-containing protein 6-like n=1 Tax=Dioscorea cayennensis subsp. rotundata TaxID=55577 RepID=A0AB40AYD7_DIOCR|nr:ankyrin repeat and SAM domain-containing protein 6-like [Dioscorea cayenensis subsp. rotundata]
MPLPYNSSKSPPVTVDHFFFRVYTVCWEMYADRLAVGTKGSIRDRLHGDVGNYLRRTHSFNGKRKWQVEENKGQHDLYEDGVEPQISYPLVGPSDLRVKLQKTSIQKIKQLGKDSGIWDLGRKLSTLPHPQPKSDQSKAKPVNEKITSVVKGAPSTEEPVPEMKKVSSLTDTIERSLQKSNSSIESLLQSLGLEKYLITFMAEEVDMMALKHMTDNDLKALGIPMGPRKKILLALNSQIHISGD